MATNILFPNDIDHKNTHIYRLSNDTIESNILSYIYPHELHRLCTISKLFNSIILSFNWNDEYIRNKEIYYLIYDKLCAIDKFLVIKAWIETCKAQHLTLTLREAMMNSRETIIASRDNIKWPIDNSCIKRKSGIIVTGGIIINNLV